MAIELNVVGAKRILKNALNGENFIKNAATLAQMSYSQAPVEALAA